MKKTGRYLTMILAVALIATACAATCAAEKSADRRDWTESGVLMQVDWRADDTFGGPMDKREVRRICFLDTCSDAPADAWDASAAGDQSVLAWNEDGTLYIAAEGGVKADPNSSYAFSCFHSLEEICFDGNFDTSGVNDMTCTTCAGLLLPFGIRLKLH